MEDPIIWKEAEAVKKDTLKNSAQIHLPKHAPTKEKNAFNLQLQQDQLQQQPHEK